MVQQCRRCSLNLIVDLGGEVGEWKLHPSLTHEAYFCYDIAYNRVFNNKDMFRIPCKSCIYFFCLNSLAVIYNLIPCVLSSSLKFDL